MIVPTQTAPRKLSVSAILLGIVGGIVGLAAGVFLGFALGAALASVFHVSGGALRRKAEEPLKVGTARLHR